jgi:hypothetical protein
MNTQDREFLQSILTMMVNHQLTNPNSQFNQRLTQIINAPDDQAGMLTAFKHAANSIGEATGVTTVHVDHEEAAQSVCGDAYYLDLIRGAEQRMGLERISFEHQTTLLNSCEKALSDRDAKLARYSMSAGHAHQCRAEAQACRDALGFSKDSETVSPVDLRQAIDQLKRQSVKYERLRAAAVHVSEHTTDPASDGWDELREALKDG